MKKKLVMWSAVFVLFLVGCIESKDPNSVKLYQLDPNSKIVKAIDVAASQAEIARAVANALSVWVPGAGIVSIGIGWFAGLWRKLNPVLAKASTKAEKFYGTTTALVSAIEDFKTTNPAEWAKISDHLSGVIGPNTENIIRAIRGLPPKT